MSAASLAEGSEISATLGAFVLICSSFKTSEYIEWLSLIKEYRWLVLQPNDVVENKKKRIRNKRREKSVRTLSNRLEGIPPNQPRLIIQSSVGVTVYRNYCRRDEHDGSRRLVID